MKNFISMALCFISVLLFSITAFANAPAKARGLTVELLQVPSNAVYADLLIQIEEDDVQYVELENQSIVEPPTKMDEIVSYSDEGYRSFTFHYKGAQSDIKLEPDYESVYSVRFGNGFSQENLLTQYEDLRKNYNKVKIALLDKDYHIISVSNVCEITKEDKLISFNGRVSYDVATGRIAASTYFNPYYLVWAIFSVIAMVVLSALIEWLVALIFKFNKKERGKILLVNVCTQAVMRILYFVLPLSYVVETIILEVLVYGSEFLIYKKNFKEKTVGNILIYTVVANTISLIIGLLVEKVL